MEQVKVRKSKSGRPKKAVCKETRAGIRFTQTEYFIIKQKALKAGLKVSAYLRQIAVAGDVKPRLTEEERQFLRQLIGMANNINQLTKMSHQEGLLKVMRYFEEYRQKIDLLIQKLTHD